MDVLTLDDLYAEGKQDKYDEYRDISEALSFYTRNPVIRYTGDDGRSVELLSLHITAELINTQPKNNEINWD